MKEGGAILGASAGFAASDIVEFSFHSVASPL